MSEIGFHLDAAQVERQPFPHFTAVGVLPATMMKQLFDWLCQTDLWKLVETSFYEQYEFSLLDISLPSTLEFLRSLPTIEYIEDQYARKFNIRSFSLVNIVAHKLVNNQRIGIHNDFISGEETHRMVLHVNPLWKEENGGLLMLFRSAKAEDLSQMVKPLDNTVFGFEISRDSHHAVSKIYDYTRYTIVYTFKQLN